MSRRQWFPMSVDVFDSDFGVDLRDQFGPVGMCLWVGFLAACKRNQVQGKIRYASDAEALMMFGLPGVELVDEDGEPFTLDDFWTFTGQRKNTKVTRSKRLVNVSATHWEQWQNSAKKEQEAERKARSRAQKERTDPGQETDEKPPDSDSDIDKDNDTDSGHPPPSPNGSKRDPHEGFDEFWSEYPRREAKGAARKAWPKAVKAAGTPETIIEGARRYAENLTAHRTEKRFIAHPASWLNAERWGDELPEPPEEEQAKGYGSVVR